MNEILKKIDLFAHMDPSARALLCDRIVRRNYMRRQVVFYENDASSHLHLLLEGRVRLYKTSPKGIQLEIHRFEAPALFAEHATFEQIPFPATCETLGETTVGKLAYNDFISLLQDHNVALGMIRSLSSKVALLSHRLHAESFWDAPRKVAHTLLYHPSLFQAGKLRDIATSLNLSPETLSRTLRRFKQAGWIDPSPRMYNVRDHDALAMLLDEEA